MNPGILPDVIGGVLVPVANKLYTSNRNLFDYYR